MVLAGFPHVVPAGQGNGRARQPTARNRASDSGCRRQSRWSDGGQRRLRRVPRRAAAAADRRCARSQLLVVDDRLPQSARPTQGGDHEPAVGRCGLRRDRRHLPVGLVEGCDRARQSRSGRGLGADDAVRHHLRPVDGLRGVPAVEDEGGVRPHRRQRRCRCRRSCRDGPGHHRRRVDHGVRVLGVRPRRRSRPQAVRARSCLGRADRRDRGPHGARAGDHGTARRPELVATEVAPADPADDRRRGSPRRAEKREPELV